MKRYIYWADGKLEIEKDGRTVHFGGRVMGECIHGEPRPGDVVYYPAYGEDQPDGSVLITP
jgi:hypothetical protein